MTEWQWRVVMALVRYVLNKEGLYDFGQHKNAEYMEELGAEDRAILIEAVVREG